MHKYRHMKAIALIAVLWATAAHAVINLHFTPIQLVKQSSLIVSVDMKQGSSKDQYTLTVLETLKGKTDKKALTLDLTKARSPEAAEALRDLAASGKPALFFVGEFKEADGESRARGLLSISGLWASCVTIEGDWFFDTIDSGFLAVWNGGTDMLRRAVDYILVPDTTPSVPATEDVGLATPPVKTAVLAGAIKTMRPVDLAGDGKQTLFVASDKGDALLACDPAKKLTDITAARSLKSTSLAYAWGTFAGQGRLDLVSYDGKTATLHSQQADGKFKASPLDLGKTLDGGCISLTALDTGSKDRPGLLVNKSALPEVVSFDAEGKATATPLTAPGIDLSKLGKAGAALVADFTGDSYADILALRENGSILFCGEAVGKFKPGITGTAKVGDAGTCVSIGDYDGDGNLDVLVFGGTARMIWINNGKGEFSERFAAVGEMMTHDQRVTSTDCMTGDINNDGRQDILVAYGNASPVTYFARGFLSFGHSHMIDISERNLLPDAKNAKDGQQAICLADLDGDGAQDLTLALKNGEIWTLFRETSRAEARMAVAALPITGAAKGPVTVTGWDDKRCLGAWNVLPGVSRANFGRTDAGIVIIKWRLPGGKEQTKEVDLEKAGNTKVEIK